MASSAIQQVNQVTMNILELILEIEYISATL